MALISALFIGDSITAGFNTKEHLPNIFSVNHAVSGDSSLECLDRISADWFTQPFDYVFLCIGTNDFARSRSDHEILSIITLVIEKILSHTRQPSLIVTSIFPTRDNVERPNSRITEFNKKLTVLAKSLQCEYFNLHPFFVDEYGDLKDEFTDDGLHLTDLAYTTWSKALEIFFSDKLK